MTSDRANAAGSPRIVVVGPCASGKSTLADRLRAIGLDVRVCGQEHSAIRNLWRKMDPEILVALALDLETLRARRSPTWPERLYEVQQDRLRDAYAAATIVIDTAETPVDDVVAQVLHLVSAESPS